MKVNSTGEIVEVDVGYLDLLHCTLEEENLEFEMVDQLVP